MLVEPMSMVEASESRLRALAAAERSDSHENARQTTADRSISCACTLARTIGMRALAASLHVSWLFLLPCIAAEASTSEAYRLHGRRLADH